MIKNLNFNINIKHDEEKQKFERKCENESDNVIQSQIIGIDSGMNDSEFEIKYEYICRKR